ncbi:MAG: BtpA/SgcQ family protein [Planctomycetes bacterium]|jgi:membrane complex biogenesis BtpA family protein|nr:BtpA/SgcQ family protein [Planctomycetota bacterium]MCP4838208.1 BtpA/SgcQ family protein [Planctomycetota bacterium]
MMSIDLSDIFGRERDILVGMVHVHALPGTAGSDSDPISIIEQAVKEACMLEEAGFDAVIVENMHDSPYMLRKVGPEVVACMTAVTSAVRCAIDLPLGIQILAGANKAALATAHASGADFIRAEGFCFATVADEGIMNEADAGPLLRYRRAIDADHIAIFADIKKKHSSHAITADLSIADWAHAAEFMGADGVIVTGHATGQDADLAEVADARAACTLPVLVGSGVTDKTVRATLDVAHGAIVGSSIKSNGDWRNAIEPERAASLIDAR